MPEPMKCPKCGNQLGKRATKCKVSGCDFVLPSDASNNGNFGCAGVIIGIVFALAVVARGDGPFAATIVLFICIGAGLFFSSVNGPSK